MSLVFPATRHPAPDAHALRFSFHVLHVNIHIMPLTKKEKDTITRVAREYGAEKLWLFGSMLDPDPEAEPNDIDLAVEGVKPEKFYSFYGELLMRLDKSVDLVDMADDLPVVNDVKETGVIIFDNGRRRKTQEGDIRRKATHR